ncbi:HXXXD-type acyl-transferase family protein [Canna indica]|uniref:HXXXD-type acyl-transferase family protein n=1 Tax=Canna indica TaxID=4628 RepID=A0AAQ3K451_9LILI|nr:HXXXD-type acyl-transferase family protein [Canna indica]
MAAEAAAAAEVKIISKNTIRPSARPNEQDGARVIHLTPWDLKMISVDYIQKGILFLKQQQQQQQQQEEEEESVSVISALRASFAITLNHFFPLAGRLVVTHHEDSESPSLSISLKCDDQGAVFIHASAPTVKVSDILDSLYVPPVLLSFFPLNGVINYDGHRFPVFAVQVTELHDGIFIGCSVNHCVADGTSFWHFMNSWSEICRTGNSHVSQPPALDRWFVDSCDPPLRLPFRSEGDFIRRPVYPSVEECSFHFSVESVAKLKAKANAEMGTGSQISSLQSLLSRFWVSVTRARGLDPQQETSYLLAIGCRTRLTPPLPDSYLGNSIYIPKITVTAGELLERGHGWGAWLLNRCVASYNESTVRDLLEEWAASPSFTYIENIKPWDLVTGSSPRFNIYGNDFGWGKPVAVRSGAGSKLDGKATVYPGPEKGSVALEVCLSPKVLSSLVKDKDFMEFVSNSKTRTGCTAS